MSLLMGGVMESREIVISLEEIRKGKKITMESFINEVVSIRQYKRYLYGEAEIPYHILVKLSKQLGIKPINLMFNINERVNSETSLLNDFHYSIVNKENDRHDLYKKMLKRKMTSERNQVYKKICIYFYDYSEKKIRRQQLLMRLGSLIKYPSILKEDYLDSIDLIALIIIFNNCKDNRAMIAAKLYMIFINKEVLISGRNNLIKPYVIMNLSKYYGMRKEFEKVIELCKLGIGIQKRIKSLYALDYFHYYLALSYREYKQAKLVEESIYNCYVVLLAEGNSAKLIKFDTLISNDFDFNSMEIVSKILNEKISRAR